jgi:hypothetical protein
MAENEIRIDLKPLQPDESHTSREPACLAIHFGRHGHHLARNKRFY